MVIAFTVVGWFGLARAFGLDSSELKQTGAYGLSRNPQVVAFMIAMIGHTMLWPSWANLGSVLLLAIIMHVMIVTEESTCALSSARTIGGTASACRATSDG